MANLFVDLPVPIGNGAGAAVDVSGMGRTKTVAYQGDLNAAIEVQISADGVDFQPLHTFPGGQRLKKTFEVAAQFMRASVSNFRGGTTANMDVGSDDIGTLVGTIVAPAGNGAGAALDVSAFGTFNTVYVSGVFTGNVVIQASDDGVDWSPCMSFSRNGGVTSKEFTAAFVRVVRDGVNPSAPGLPDVFISAVNDPTAGGAAAGGGQPNCLIYRQGDVNAGPVVFGAWADLIAELGTLRAAANGAGCYQILFDNSVTAAMSIPVGIYDMTDVEWVVPENRDTSVFAGEITVTVPEGVELPGLRAFRGKLIVDCTATITPPILDAVANEVFWLRDGAALQSAAGAVPFINLAALGAGEAVTFDMSAIGVLGSLAGVSVLNIPTAAFVLFNLGLQATINVDSIAGIAGSGVIYNFLSTNVFVGEPQTAFLGGVTTNFQADLRFDNRPVRVAPAAMQFNDFVALDSSGGTFTQTLPSINAGAERSEGLLVAVKEVSSTGGSLIAPAAGDTIDGAAGALTLPAFGCVVLESNGVSNWRVVSRYSFNAALLFWSDNSVAAGGDTRFLTPGNNGTSSTTNDFPLVIARPAVLRNLAVRHNAAAGNGNSVVYTVMVNGVATGITVTLASGAVGQAIDAVNSAAVVAGDRVSLRAVKAVGIGAGGVQPTATLEVRY